MDGSRLICASPFPTFSIAKLEKFQPDQWYAAMQAVADALQSANLTRIPRIGCVNDGHGNEVGFCFTERADGTFDLSAVHIC